MDGERDREGWGDGLLISTLYHFAQVKNILKERGRQKEGKGTLFHHHPVQSVSLLLEQLDDHFLAADGLLQVTVFGFHWEQKERRRVPGQ